MLKRKKNPGSHLGFCFLFNVLISIYLFEYETIETHGHAFLTLIILAIGRVIYLRHPKR